MIPLAALVLLALPVAAHAGAGGPDCGTVACPKLCKCNEKHCAKEVSDCMGDSHCARVQGCVSKCKCGDHLCTTECALSDPHAVSHLKELLACSYGYCWSETDDVLNRTYAAFGLDSASEDALAPPSPPDCSTVACSSTCQCTESKCAKEVGDCMADKNCAGLQGCVTKCKCGDHACTIGCALSNIRAFFTAKPLLSCTKEKCWSGTDASVTV